MLRLLNNGLYRLNYWLDRNELSKFLIMLSVVGFSNVMLVCSNSLYGIIPILIVCAFTLVRMKFQTGDWDFKKDIYKVPEVGDVFVIKKDFYWDGGFKKFINLSDPSRKPWYYYIKVGTEWRVTELKDKEGDWKIYLVYTGNDPYLQELPHITIKYFESRKYWKTKSDIRDEKLRKIGI